MVEQVQCCNWPDLLHVGEALDTKIMLDLHKLVKDLLNLYHEPGCLLVHCSAGAGRTGAFIALFKLVLDVENSEPIIDPFSTVVEMRRARRKMIQKPSQYYYVIQCLSNFVEDMSDYV